MVARHLSMLRNDDDLLHLNRRSKLVQDFKNHGMRTCKVQTRHYLIRWEPRCSQTSSIDVTCPNAEFHRRRDIKIPPRRGQPSSLQTKNIQIRVKFIQDEENDEFLLRRCVTGTIPQRKTMCQMQRRMESVCCIEVPRAIQCNEFGWEWHFGVRRGRRDRGGGRSCVPRQPPPFPQLPIHPYVGSIYSNIFAPLHLYASICIYI